MGIHGLASCRACNSKSVRFCQSLNSYNRRFRKFLRSHVVKKPWKFMTTIFKSISRDRKSLQFISVISKTFPFSWKSFSFHHQFYGTSYIQRIIISHKWGFLKSKYTCYLLDEIESLWTPLSIRHYQGKISRHIFLSDSLER